VSKRKIPLHPKHPERTCWGCDKYCPADDLRCGNGPIRTQHPVELFSEDWLEWELETQDGNSQMQEQYLDSWNSRTSQYCLGRNRTQQPSTRVTRY
jgi:hypothetical protein